jgi:hypothetical protein
MSGDLHYQFPPARAYRLNRFLFSIKSDTAFRQRYTADPAASMLERGLEPDERAALEAWDRDRLVALGAHPYLVFMADLRVRMDRGTGKFEYF